MQSGLLNRFLLYYGEVIQLSSISVAEPVRSMWCEWSGRTSSMRWPCQVSLQAKGKGIRQQWEILTEEVHSIQKRIRCGAIIFSSMSPPLTPIVEAWAALRRTGCFYTSKSQHKHHLLLQNHLKSNLIRAEHLVTPHFKFYHADMLLSSALPVRATGWRALL